MEVAAAGFGTVVTIAGEPDMATAPRLRSALASSSIVGSDAVVVDLAGVTFMDSTGLAVLLTFDRELRERGGTLAIACPEGPARLLFDVTGTDEHLRLYPTRDAAEAAVSA